MSVRDRKTFWSGVIFAAVGLGALTKVAGFDIGTPTRMGPGFFPLLLSILLVGIGGTAVFRSFRCPEIAGLDPWPFVPAAVVTAAVLSFAALIGSRGIVPAVAVLILVSCAMRVPRRPLEVLAVGGVLIAMSVAIFVYGIQLPVALW